MVRQKKAPREWDSNGARARLLKHDQPRIVPPCACRPGESQPLGDARPCLSSIRPELLAKGRERTSNEHQDGQAEGNFAYY